MNIYFSVGISILILVFVFLISKKLTGKSEYTNIISAVFTIVTGIISLILILTNIDSLKYIQWSDPQFGRMISIVVGKDSDKIKPSDVSDIEHLLIFGNDKVYITDVSYNVSNKKLDGKDYDFSSEGAIKSLNDLKYFPHLKTLKIWKNEISNVSAIDSCSELTEVLLSSNSIENLNGFDKLGQLEHLYLSNNSICDISAIESLTKLKILSLGTNKLVDITCVQNLVNLEILSIPDNKITNIPDLSRLINLKYIYIGNNLIRDISGLKNVKTLIEFYAGYNLISDITPLERCLEIKKISLPGNKVKDITTIGRFKNLNYLDFDQNYIHNIDELRKNSLLDTVYLRQNSIQNYESILHVENVYTDLSDEITFDLQLVLNDSHLLIKTISDWEIVYMQYLLPNQEEVTIYDSIAIIPVSNEMKKISLFAKDVRGNVSLRNENNEYTWINYSIPFD